MTRRDMRRQDRKSNVELDGVREAKYGHMSDKHGCENYYSRELEIGFTIY